MSGKALLVKQRSSNRNCVGFMSPFRGCPIERMKLQSGIRLISLDSTFNIKPRTRSTVIGAGRAISAISPSQTQKPVGAIQVTDPSVCEVFGGIATGAYEADLRNLSEVETRWRARTAPGRPVIIPGRRVAIQLLRSNPSNNTQLWRE